jgi:nitroimidazol reductase NimA-like FMN-containing flavoprotein (pyridoxamine 5'-phosphate oxidase superfamily)
MVRWSCSRDHFVPILPAMPTAAASARTRVKRAPKRALYDRAQIDAILDEALVCHVGFVHDGQPYVIPMLHARVGDVVYIHGSTASRLVRTLAGGAPCSLTVTLLDGIVLARSAFHHSANYRSVTVLGRASLVESEEQRLQALEAFSEHLVPGRWDVVRPPNRKELKATQVLALALDEASAKMRTGPPVDDDEDMDRDVWAGVLPLALQARAPQPDPQLHAGTATPEHVAHWNAARLPPDG